MKRRKLGAAFSEEILKVTRRFGHFKPNKIKDDDWEDAFLPKYRLKMGEGKISSWKPLFLEIIFLLTFFGLFLRLFHLQIVMGEEFRQRADTNRIAMKIIHAPRGVIYDRNGQVLAESNPGFKLDKKSLSSIGNIKKR